MKQQPRPPLRWNIASNPLKTNSRPLWERPQMGQKKSKGNGKKSLQGILKKKGTLPPPRKLLPLALPVTLKTPTAKVPRMPKEKRNPRDAKSHSMGRRLPSPPTCANRYPSNKGDRKELWIHPQCQYLHPSKRTSCAGRHPHGGLVHPLHK